MLYMSVPVFLLYTPYNCSASIVFIEIYMQPLLHSFSLTNSFDVAWNTIIQFWYEDDDIHTSRTPSSDFPYPKNYWRSELQDLLMAFFRNQYTTDCQKTPNLRFMSSDKIRPTQHLRNFEHEFEPSQTRFAVNHRRGEIGPLLNENFEERAGLGWATGLPRLMSFIDQYCIDLDNRQLDE